MRSYALMLICAVATMLPFPAVAQHMMPMPGQAMPGAVLPNSAVQSFAPIALNSSIPHQQCINDGGQAFPIGEPVFQNATHKFYQMKCVQPQMQGCIVYAISDKLASYPNEEDVEVCSDTCCGIGGGSGVLLPDVCCGCRPPCRCSASPRCGRRTRCLPMRQRSCGCCLRSRCCQQKAPCVTETYCPVSLYALDANYTYWRAAKCQQIGLCVPTWSNKILRYPRGQLVILGCNPFNNCQCFTAGGTLMQ